MKLLLAPLAAIAFIGAAPAPAPANWVNRVVQAPNGMLVMGNPAAKVKFVEYISYTCPHCAKFIGEAAEPMRRDYVSKGLVSVEFRNAVRDPFDFTAALVARCGPATKFHGNSEAIMAAQNDWIDKAMTYRPPAAKMSTTAQLQSIMRSVGLDKLMASRGYNVAQLDACIANAPLQASMSRMRVEAFEKRKITGTPAFLVNGALLENIDNWPLMDSLIKTALTMR